MRWFFGLVLVIAVVAGALYAVGRFLLPNDLAVSRSVVIDRPRASVFAMVNDLRIVKEWSPYYALDPEANYAFSGAEAGLGQTMRWSSSVAKVGRGSMSIVRSEENREVETILQLADRATLTTRMELIPAEGATSVNWAVSATCSTGWINVPCRYMNLIMARMIEKDLDTGLARLKTLSEQLLDVDFEGLNPEFLNVDSQPYVFSPVTTSNQNQAQVDAALNLGVQQVDQFMNQFQLAKAGPQVRVTTHWDQAQGQMSFRVGYPFTGPAPLTVVGVQIGNTPSGQVMRVVHEGPRAELRNTYAAIYAYLQAHRISVREGENGLPWEVVQSDAPEAARYEIYMPLQ